MVLGVLQDAPELVEEPERLCGSECCQFEPLQLANGPAGSAGSALFPSRGVKGVSGWMEGFKTLPLASVNHSSPLMNLPPVLPEWNQPQKLHPQSTRTPLALASPLLIRPRKSSFYFSNINSR